MSNVVILNLHKIRIKIRISGKTDFLNRLELYIVKLVIKGFFLLLLIFNKINYIMVNQQKFNRYIQMGSNKKYLYLEYE